jgi:hypothetical protein
MGDGVLTMELTRHFSRIAAIRIRTDARGLREQLAGQLYEWQAGSSQNREQVRHFWTRVGRLAAMVGGTKDTVYQDLKRDARSIADTEECPDEDEMDSERTSAKKKYKAVNPWAVCHSQLGPEKDEKFESCVQDVKKKHKIKKD